MDNTIIAPSLLHCTVLFYYLEENRSVEIPTKKYSKLLQLKLKMLQPLEQLCLDFNIVENVDIFSINIKFII